MPNKLNAIFCKKTTKLGRHHDGGGLYLNVTASKAKAASEQGADTLNKSWLLRWGENGRHSMGLGRLADVSLADARIRAEELRRQIRQGIDPRKAQEQARQDLKTQQSRLTVREATEAFLATHQDGWRNDKHRDQWRNTLNAYVMPRLGDAVCAEITADQVRETLAPIWKTKPETASRVRGRLEKILDWASVREGRAHSGANPARWKGVQELLLGSHGANRQIEHHAAMPNAEVPAFWKRLESVSGVSVQALKFTILTACRTNEVIKARWDEIDLDAAVWTIPAQRMKAGKQHRVPLSTAAMKVLQQMKQVQNGDYVFWSDRSRRSGHLSNMAMLMLLRNTLEVDDYTVHGFRSTFRDWVAESHGLDTEVAEHALAHQLTDKVVAAYLRTEYMDKRRHMMEAWAAYCTMGVRPASPPQFKPVTAAQTLATPTVQIAPPVMLATWATGAGSWGLTLPTGPVASPVLSLSPGSMVFKLTPAK